MKKQTAKQPEIVKGYKVFNPDFTAKEKGFQYAENTEFVHKGEIKICASGFHFCTNAADCFNYYSFDPANIVCEVEGRGKIQTHDEDSKVCTDILFVGRKMTWEEVLVVANSGKHNTGRANSGSWNSGDRNSGSWNSGYRNSGYRNSGYRNSGAFCTAKDPKMVLFDKGKIISFASMRDIPVNKPILVDNYTVIKLTEVALEYMKAYAYAKTKRDRLLKEIKDRIDQLEKSDGQSFTSQINEYTINWESKF